MIITILLSGYLLTSKGSEWNVVGNPVSEDNLGGNRLRPVVSVELDMKMVALHQRINCDSLVILVCISLCGHHEWDLT